MSFSASPLMPGAQGAGTDPTGGQVVGLVAGAVAAALAQIPSPVPLAPGEPVTDPAAAALPPTAGVAITGYLGGGVEGKVVLVVAQELVDALAATPFGALEPAQALKPALDTIADQLGGRLDGAPTSIAVEGCLDVLAGGLPVIVPLESAGQLISLVGVSLSQVPAAVAGTPAGGAGGGPGAGTGTAGAAAQAGGWGIDLLRDVEMEVTCELGRTRMTVRQLLALAPGDVVELDRLAGSPADLLVNGTLLARGEVVVVDESFGLRITEIVTGTVT